MPHKEKDKGMGKNGGNKSQSNFLKTAVTKAAKSKKKKKGK